MRIVFLDDKEYHLPEAHEAYTHSGWKVTQDYITHLEQKIEEIKGRLNEDTATRARKKKKTKRAAR
tara:strand:+ start:904 stop:1101 length:198 start_codon:yes stop_codon:yes gene_type:complete